MSSPVTTPSSYWDSSREERIPHTLQAVFNASNRGKLYDKAPPDRVAFKVFRRRWRFSTPRRALQREASLASEKTSSWEDMTSKNSDSSSFNSEEGPVPRIVTRSQSMAHSLTGIDQRMGSFHMSERSTSSSVTCNHISPHAYLTALLRNRGYSTKTYTAVDTAYHTPPTPIQQASYGLFFVDCVAQNELEIVRELLRMGLSPNACNGHGESIVHMVCRLGLPDMLLLLLEFGASVQVADDLGRTPFHEACSPGNPCFAVSDILLGEDPDMLYLADAQGIMPLQYLKDENWTVWTKYLMSRKDQFFPERNIQVEGYRPVNVWCTTGPEHDRIIADPVVVEAIDLKTVAMAARGRISALKSAHSEKVLQLAVASAHTLLDTDGEEDYEDPTESEVDHEASCSAGTMKEETILVTTTKAEDADDVSVATFDEDEVRNIIGSFR